jgi:hypothetical protein
MTCNDDNIVRLNIIKHAIRWCANILIEVTGNHSQILTEESRQSLRKLTNSIQQVEITLKRKGP